MNIALIGLGRMGRGIAQRLISAGHAVFGFDLNEQSCIDAQSDGVVVNNKLSDLAQQARVFWLMVPQGNPVDAVIKELMPQLKAGDVIIDGGNSNYKDSMRRAQMLAEHDVAFLDCGTSGGVHGMQHGFCLMVGGDTAAYNKVKPAFDAVASPGGVALVGPSGAGHYVKMVHNGIEYGLLQAYAEGFHLMKDGAFKDADLDLAQITQLWNTSSVIRSWLLELAHNVFQEDQEFKNISGEIAEGGTGRWTVEEAHQQNIQVPVIEASLQARAWSRKTGGNYTTKMIALLRNQFGGHAVKKVS